MAVADAYGARGPRHVRSGARIHRRPRGNGALPEGGEARARLRGRRDLRAAHRRGSRRVSAESRGAVRDRGRRRRSLATEGRIGSPVVLAHGSPRTVDCGARLARPISGRIRRGPLRRPRMATASRAAGSTPTRPGPTTGGGRRGERRGLGPTGPRRGLDGRPHGRHAGAEGPAFDRRARRDRGGEHRLPPSEESLDAGTALADGLERRRDGFIEAYDRGLDPEWRETLLRIGRERLGRQRHPDAWRRRCARSRARCPSMARELEGLDVRPWCSRAITRGRAGASVLRCRGLRGPLPPARLISEAAGEEPARWQGGRLSGRIAASARRIGCANGSVRDEPARDRVHLCSSRITSRGPTSLVDRADLVVDEAGRKGDLADDVSVMPLGTPDARFGQAPRDRRRGHRSAKRGRRRSRSARRVQKATITSQRPPHAALHANPCGKWAKRHVEARVAVC